MERSCWGNLGESRVGGVRRPLARLISTSVFLLAHEGVRAIPLLTPAHKLFGEKFNQKPTAQTSAP